MGYLLISDFRVAVEETCLERKKRSLFLRVTRIAGKRVRVGATAVQRYIYCYFGGLLHARAKRPGNERCRERAAARKTLRNLLVVIVTIIKNLENNRKGKREFIAKHIAIVL